MNSERREQFIASSEALKLGFRDTYVVSRIQEGSLLHETVEFVNQQIFEHVADIEKFIVPRPHITLGHLASGDNFNDIIQNTTRQISDLKMSVRVGALECYPQSPLAYLRMTVNDAFIVAQTRLKDSIKGFIPENNPHISLFYLEDEYQKDYISIPAIVGQINIGFINYTLRDLEVVRFTDTGAQYISDPIII